MNHPNIDYIRQFVNNSNPKDEYKLITEIGSGTYGDVYKALHFKTNNYVAIKIMKIDLKDDVTAICQEIHTLRECKHDNIVQFYGSYLQSTKLWICMEYCGGQSMQDIYLNLRRPIDEDSIAFISRETLRGLDYMHKRSRIHRDIKGANILLTDNGEVKIADFGIAAQLSSTVAKRSTLIGTPYWMAPEVAAVNNRSGGYDERCDVWAVGITAIEYAELQPPMFDLHPMKALQILAQRTYTPPKLQKRDKWSAKFQMFLKYSLLKNERKRPTAEVMLTHEFVIQDHLCVSLTQDLLRRNRKELKLPVNLPQTKDKPNNKSEPTQLPAYADGNNGRPVGAAAAIPPNNMEQPKLSPSVAQFGNITRLSLDETPLSLLNNLSNDGHVDSSNADDTDDFLISLDKELQKRGHMSLLKKEGERNSFYDNCPKDGAKSSSDKDRICSSLGDLHLVVSDNRGPRPNPSIQGGSPQVLPPPVPPQRPRSMAGSSGDVLTSGGSQQKPSRPDKPPQYLPELNVLDDNVAGVATGPSQPPTPATPKTAAANNKRVSQQEFLDEFDRFNIPQIPKVHMGACFALIFEGCPLKINSSGSWTNPATKDKLMLLGTNDGIYYLNTNEMHEKSLEMLVPRPCLWLSIIRDTMMTLSGRGPQLYTHNLVSLIRMKPQEQSMGRLTTRLLPKRFRPSSKLPDTKGCQMVSIIRNPFTGSKYMCAAVGKQIFLYEWFSPHSSFIEIKRVDVPVMPCPLLNFDLLVSREQNLPIVCLSVSRTTDTDKYKLNLVNMEENNRSVWFQSPPGVEDRMDLVKVLQIEPNTLLMCFPERAIFLNMSGRVKTSRNKINSLEFGTCIESVVGLRDSILVFHTHGLKGIDFSDQVTQDITDEKHIYRLLSSDTYTNSILVESKPSDNPMDNGNIYMLIGHQDP